MRRTVLFGLWLLGSCVSNSGVRPLRPNEIATAPYRQGATQSFVGSLMYEGGCLLFDSEDGHTRLLPVWPIGSRFEESLITFHQPAKSDQRAIIGEEIRLDGQPADWSELAGAQFAPFQTQCGAMPFFVSGLAPAN